MFVFPLNLDVVKICYINNTHLSRFLFSFIVLYNRNVFFFFSSQPTYFPNKSYRYQQTENFPAFIGLHIRIKLLRYDFFSFFLLYIKDAIYSAAMLKLNTAQSDSWPMRFFFLLITKKKSHHLCINVPYHDSFHKCILIEKIVCSCDVRRSQIKINYIY